MKAKINGINIDYRDEGAGLPVILIHAFPLNQTMWDEQVSALRGRLRVVTLDLRGFGRSDVPAGPYLMDQMASDIRALMSALSIERAVIAGLSMGGYISLAFYRNYPDAVHALVLADTRASADTEEGRGRRMKSAEKAEREGAAAIADDMVSLLLARATVENRPDVVRRVREMIEANSPQAIAAAQNGMAARADSIYILAGVSCPTLILVGSEDTLTPPAEAEALRNGIPGSNLQVIEGAGHLSNMERPSEFNNALINFIEEVASQIAPADH